MGKPTGFMEYRRASLAKQSVEERLRHFREFESSFDEEMACEQGARCMDCGVPFCHGETGCPVENLIPEWNDLVWRGKWRQAVESLHSTNNFPEFTGRLCPAPCESACVLGITDQPVSIKSLERTIIDRAYDEGWVEPHPADILTGKKVAVVGSGPAGLACAQQLARAGHSVVVFEKYGKPGGLLRYGIPDYKLEKSLIDRRIDQMELEGVKFRCGIEVGVDIEWMRLHEEYDALVLAIGAEAPLDIRVPGREAKNIYFAMDYLVEQNRVNDREKIEERILATDKHVIVIGGGDTGSDCVGVANRQGAHSVTMLRRSPMPPRERPDNQPWPLLPDLFRVSTSIEEGVNLEWCVNVKGFKTDRLGQVTALQGSRLEKRDGKFHEVAGTDFEWPADLVLIAMGYAHPSHEGLLDSLKVEGLKFDRWGSVEASFGDEPGNFATSVPGVYACGDVRRGQSLIVWAIAEGRKCAAEVNRVLTRPVRKVKEAPRR